MRIVLVYFPQLCSPNCTPLKNIPLFSAQILTCLFGATTQSNCYYNLIHKLTVHHLHLNFKNHSYTWTPLLFSTHNQKNTSLLYRESLSVSIVWGKLKKIYKKAIKARKQVQSKTFWDQSNLTSQRVVPYLQEKLLLSSSRNTTGQSKRLYLVEMYYVD